MVDEIQNIGFIFSLQCVFYNIKHIFLASTLFVYADIEGQKTRIADYISYSIEGDKMGEDSFFLEKRNSQLFFGFPRRASIAYKDANPAKGEKSDTFFVSGKDTLFFEKLIWSKADTSWFGPYSFRIRENHIQLFYFNDEKKRLVYHNQYSLTKSDTTRIVPLFSKPINHLSNLNRAVYLGDSILKMGINSLFDCYTFKLLHVSEHIHDWSYTGLVFLDKKSLIPIKIVKRNSNWSTSYTVSKLY